MIEERRGAVGTAVSASEFKKMEHLVEFFQEV